MPKISREISREEYSKFIRWKMGEYDISVNIISPHFGNVQCNKNGIAQAQMLIDAENLSDFIEDGIGRDDTFYPIRNLAGITGKTSDFAKFSLDMAKAVGFSDKNMAELEKICAELPSQPTITARVIETAREGLAELRELVTTTTDPEIKSKIADLQSLVRAGDAAKEALAKPDEIPEEPRAGFGGPS